MSSDTAHPARVPASWALYYSCPDNYRFLARMEDDGERVYLVLPDTAVRLPRVVSASGAKYSDGTITFWTKGEEALLEAPGESGPACLQESGEPWEGARSRGVGFRATGNEPGWYLEIDVQGRTQLVADYGEARYVFPAVQLEEQAPSSRTVYRYEADGHVLIVVVEDEPCRDSMSGFPFEATATITIDGRELRGCGRWLQEES